MDPRTQQMLSAPPLPLLVGMAAPSTVAFFIQGSVSLAEDEVGRDVFVGVGGGL